MVAIDEQSPDIAQGVDESFEAQHGDTDPLDLLGAGDQGMMFGYATRETEELMPLPIMLAHKLAKRLAEVRKADVLPYLRPDGKTQVTVRYEVDEHGIQRPVEIERVLISTQHRDGLDTETLIKPDLLEHVVEPILHSEFRSLFDPARLGAKDFLYVNPTGKFVIGGPMGDTGLTGPQDHRRHVRRRGTARRRRLLGQGSDEGRPLGRVRGALCREERRRRRARGPLPDPGRVRDRRRAPDERARRVLRDRDRLARRRIERLVHEHFDLRPGAIIRDLDLHAADLREDRRLRPLRPRRPRLHLGAHRQGRRAQRRRGARPDGCRLARLDRPQTRRRPARPR